MTQEIYLDLQWGAKHVWDQEKFDSCAKLGDPPLAGCYETTDEMAVWWMLSFAAELAEKLEIDLDDLLARWRLRDAGSVEQPEERGMQNTKFVVELSVRHPDGVAPEQPKVLLETWFSQALVEADSSGMRSALNDESYIFSARVVGNTNLGGSS